MVKVYNRQVLVSHLSIGCGPPRMRVPLPLDTKYTNKLALPRKTFVFLFGHLHLLSREKRPSGSGHENPAIPIPIRRWSCFGV